MKAKVRFTLLAMVLALGIFGVVCGADASSNFPGIYNSYFGTTPSCSLCHTSAPALNATGTTMLNAGGNTVAGWTSIKPADTTSPTVTITTPATNPYSASSSPLSIAGTASDNFTGPFGVTQISWSNSLGGSGTATGTTSWSGSIPLSSGSNVITVTARDQAGNTTSATRTVNYAAAVVAPVISSFTATPTSITSGQSSTLSWTLSGGAPTTLSINNGVGSVLGSTSRAVTPSAATTYILTAKNSGGTVTQSVNVTVTSSGNAPPSPDQLPSFSHPTQITNPYFPLAKLKRHILEGIVGGQAVRVERTLKDRTQSFRVGKQKVRTLIMEDRAFVDGELEEIALDYFGQADDGTVYYFGEDVNIYSNGKVVSHEGAWRYGVNTNQLGIIMPARPKVGTEFQAEYVPGITTEDDLVVSVGETVTVPAGTFKNCLKIQETLSDGSVEYKYYAPNVGVIKEVTEDGEINLISFGEPRERGQED